MNGLDPPKRFKEGIAIDVSRRQAQRWHTRRMNQLRRDGQEALSQAPQCGALQTRRQAEALEPIQEVVCHQRDLKEASLPMTTGS